MYRLPPSLRKNRERRRLWIAVVNRVPVYIYINYFFVLSLTVEKAQVGRKIALASVHRLAEHLHAMSTQIYRYKISDYRQARSSVSPKIALMYLLFESWTVGSCRFQIRLCVHSCRRNEPRIHTRFSYEISTSPVSLDLMEMSSKTFNPFKDFQSDHMQRSSLKIFTAHYVYRNADLNLTSVIGATNGFIFSNNQFINRIFLG